MGALPPSLLCLTNRLIANFYRRGLFLHIDLQIIRFFSTPMQKKPDPFLDRVSCEVCLGYAFALALGLEALGFSAGAGVALLLTY